MRRDHPTVVAANRNLHELRMAKRWSSQELIQLCRECGADDAGVIRLDIPAMDSERPHVLRAYPSTKSLLCFVVRMAPEPIRSPMRSLANHEFHSTGHAVQAIARKIVRRLHNEGVGALHSSAGFPMEMGEFPGRTWVVSHKLVAEAAGLGKMGIHRSVIHPKFGSFILLDTILLDVDLDSASEPIDFNPCLECKLCVAACTVGAIAPDGHFDSVACLNHNYREFMGGFIDWVDTVTDSSSSKKYQERQTNQETASLWQSLAFGANYKAAYCLAACPAGEDVIGPFLRNKANFIETVLNPLQEKVEPVYVVAGSDAEAHVLKRFPHKNIRRIHSGVRPSTIARLLFAMPLAFQRGRSKGIDLVFHFEFSGREKLAATISIRGQKLEIVRELVGKPDLAVKVDSQAWLDFIAQRRSLPSLLLTRQLRFRGNLRHLKEFGKCFPS